MTCPHYDPGETPEFLATFVDPDGAACDPALVTADVKPPTGADPVDVTVTRLAVGEYEVTVDAVTTPGWYWLRVVGTGAACGATDETTKFQVTASRF